MQNNPIRYTDPTGHEFEEDTNGVDCIDDCKVAFLGAVVKKSNRSEFEKNVLVKLLSAGTEGMHTANYVLENNVSFDNLTYQPFGTGAGWNMDGSISFTSNLSVFPDKDRSLPNPDNWTVSLIAHEVSILSKVLG